MSLHFRHYKDKALQPKRSGEFRYGFVFYDRRQPTLDILFNKHVFVVFWKRNGKD